jgi:hypothetical protein
MTSLGRPTGPAIYAGQRTFDLHVGIAPYSGSAELIRALTPRGNQSTWLVIKYVVSATRGEIDEQGFERRPP